MCSTLVQSNSYPVIGNVGVWPWMSVGHVPFRMLHPRQNWVSVWEKIKVCKQVPHSTAGEITHSLNILTVVYCRIFRALPIYYQQYKSTTCTFYLLLDHPKHFSILTYISSLFLTDVLFFCLHYFCLVNSILLLLCLLLSSSSDINAFIVTLC